jgi:hypothetical protein
MKLKYIHLFEAFSLGDPSKVSYLYPEKKGYTTFYLEVFLKNDFISTWCSLVKIVIQEVADELNKEGWELSRLDNTVYKSGKKKKEEKSYKLCKSIFISELDYSLSSSDKKYICNLFARRILNKLAYVEDSDIKYTGVLNLDSAEKVICKVQAGGSVESIAYF